MTAKNGPKGWTLNTGKEGARILFKDYQKAILDSLTEYPDQFVTYTSKEMHEALKKKGIKISRASVIFYMNFLVDDGLATYTEETGKGGYHRVYSIASTWADVKRHIMIRVVEGLAEGLDEDLDDVLAKWLA